MNEAVLYTMQKCPKCAVLKQALDKNGLQYKSFDDVDMLLSMGITSVPMLEVDGVRMNYCDALAWIVDKNQRRNTIQPKNQMNGE